MPDDRYQTFTVVWDKRVVEVSVLGNWLGGDHWHIELRSKEVLPLTSTGYRSIFVPMAALADHAAIQTQVMTWLDEAAEDAAWLRNLEASRQYSLL